MQKRRWNVSPTARPVGLPFAAVRPAQAEERRKEVLGEPKKRMSKKELGEVLKASGLPRLYFAYGMNTEPRAMAVRCPSARPIGKATLHGWRLQFRGCADIVESAGGSLEGVVWAIYPGDEMALDRLEGYPIGYEKRVVLVVPDKSWGKEPVPAMVYIMTDRRRDRAIMPSEYYKGMLEDGYQSFGIPFRQIKDALEEARRYTVRATNGIRYLDY